VSTDRLYKCPVHGPFDGEAWGRISPAPGTLSCPAIVDAGYERGYHKLCGVASPRVSTQHPAFVSLKPLAEVYLKEHTRLKEIAYGLFRLASPPPQIQVGDPVAAVLNQGPEPTPKLYDGLPAFACLARYEARQRGDTECHLTPAQLTVAREMWSAQLRAKVQATAKPKLTVMVDDAELP